MVQRVSHGSCPRCGKAILYQGASFCSPQCHASALAPEIVEERKPRCTLCQSEVEPDRSVCGACTAKMSTSKRPPLVLDVETELITDAVPVPSLVCAGLANRKDFWIFHHSESRTPFEAALDSDCLFVGHNVAFDMVVCCATWPDLIPKVFDVYEQDRVTDTMLRERLVDIAEGVFVKGRTYSLEECVLRRCGIQLEKGEWQLRFGELRHLPVEQWPERAVHYVAGDIVSTLALYAKQEQDRYWLQDQFRQARHAFAAELTSAWGLKTDPASVHEYKQGLLREYTECATALAAAGLMQPKSKNNPTLVRKMKPVRERVEAAYKAKGKKPPSTAPSTSHPDGQVCTDADTCNLSGDELLKQYGALLSINSMLDNYVPVLEAGTVNPIHAHYTTLLTTGRTSTSPNTQNYPTEEGVRECFVPRDGYVFIVVDYAGIELRTWAQVCMGLFGETAYQSALAAGKSEQEARAIRMNASQLAKALNEGVDPHTKMASLILGIAYEEAVADYARDRKGRVYYPRQAGKAGNFGFPGGAGYESWREYARTSYGVDIPLEDSNAPIDAKRMKKFWREAWPESDLYKDWITAQCDAGNGGALIEQAFTGRFRGGLRFTEASNTLFQGLAADIAKYAWFMVCKACFAQPESPLYGSRPVNFVHDEIVTETPDTANAHFAAKEQERIMIECAKPFLPDITNIECETLLARRWSKAAKPVKDESGRLVPWDLVRKKAA